MHERYLAQCPFHLDNENPFCPPTCPNHVTNSVAAESANVEMEIEKPKYEAALENLTEEEVAASIEQLKVEKRIWIMAMILANSPIFLNCARKDEIEIPIIGGD